MACNFLCRGSLIHLFYFTDYTTVKRLKNAALNCYYAMNEHVSIIARKSYFALCRLASIYTFLTNAAASTLIYVLFCYELTTVT